MLEQVCVLLSVLHRCLSADLTYYVEEGKSPGTYIGDISADSHLMDSVQSQDRSLITFSQLQKGVVGGSNLFRVTKKTGKLYTAQILDAETLCTYSTECFKMVDVAVRKATSFIRILEVKVTIKDINDHQPEFPDKQVNITFSEGDGKGMRKSIPNAIDRDVGVANSQINYELKNKENEPFTLSVSKSLDGTSKLSIDLKDRLDREVKDSYLVQVIAKDGGSQPKQSILDVHISVTDVNDNTPIFSQNVYNVSISNEHERIIPVASLFATDLDSGKNGKISYYFSSKTSEIAKNHFELNPITGEIFLRKKFPLGKEMIYKLFVEATDGGSPPLSSIAMVLVNVINQQNNAPTIDVNFISASTGKTAIISEDIAVGSFIAYVKVTDLDIGQNGEVSCDLHHNKFQLQSLGTKKYKVVVKNPVDRETDDHHDITIICQDKGFPPLHSESKFSIQVTDVNDVQPQFSRDTFKFSIFENQKSKFHVGYINASDPDQGPGGKLTYSLLTNDKDFIPFQISDSGLISTVMSLDHEFKDVYKFQVFVKDNGRPSLNNTAKVIIEVRDKNDNAPYFTFPNLNPFIMDVVYYPHRMSNITVLKASDRDSRENAFLKYEIIGGNDEQLFTINHYTGLLSFSRVVTPQDAGSYDLQFAVKDSGTPVLSANTTLSLMLTVSNKTSEMLNAVNIQSDDKIQLYLLILIVLVAVTVSVPVTVVISICIIRCNDRQNSETNTREGSPSNRSVSEPRHLVCPSHVATSCSAVPIASTANQNMGRTIHKMGSGREAHLEGEICEKRKGSGSGLKHQTTPEVCVRQSTFSSSESEDKRQTLMSADYYSGRSTISSRADSGRGWSEGEVPDFMKQLYP